MIKSETLNALSPKIVDVKMSGHYVQDDLGISRDFWRFEVDIMSDNIPIDAQRKESFIKAMMFFIFSQVNEIGDDHG